MSEPNSSGAHALTPESAQDPSSWIGARSLAHAAPTRVLWRTCGRIAATEKEEAVKSLMHFDFAINLGTILHLLVLVGGGFVWGMRLSRRLDSIEFKLHMLWSEFKREHELLNGTKS